ncbi:hypothetical protein ACSBR1_040425 [Camellia fascicularis]
MVCMLCVGRIGAIERNDHGEVLVATSTKLTSTMGVDCFETLVVLHLVQLSCHLGLHYVILEALQSPIWVCIMSFLKLILYRGSSSTISDRAAFFLRPFGGIHSVGVAEC